MPLRQYPQPTESGWYWAETDDNGPEVIYVYKGYTGRIMATQNANENHQLAEQFTFLSERLEPPYEFWWNRPEEFEA